MSMFDKMKSFLESAESARVLLFFILANKKVENGQRKTYYHVRKCDISEEVGSVLLENVRNVIAGLHKARNEEKLEITKFEPGLHRENAFVQIVPAEEITSASKIISNFELVDLKRFDEKQELGDVVATVTYIKNPDGEDFSAFRTFSQRKFLGPGQFAFVFKNGNFGEITDQIIVMDNKIDCVHYQSEFLVINPNEFERIFNLKEMYIKELKVTLTSSSAIAKVVADPSKLLEMCESDIRKIRKLKRILRKRSEFPSSEKIAKVIRDFDLKLELDKNKSIKIDSNMTSKRLWTVLKILEDDYLFSPATETKYEAHSKAKI